jgi:hypothetical protein
MATIRMGRPEHYQVQPLDPHTSVTQLGICQCGATWDHTTNQLYDSFSDWMMSHPEPIRAGAPIQWSSRKQCSGSGEPIHEARTDGNGVGLCPICKRDKPTSPEEGYEGWRKFDPHPTTLAATR